MADWGPGLLECSGVVALVSLYAFGMRQWARALGKLTRRLDAARVVDPDSRRRQAHYDPRELDGLPEPVQRYFRAVLKEWQPIIDTATVRLTGVINMSGEGQQRKPFASQRRVVMNRPGFVWDARVAMAPGMPVHMLGGNIAVEGALRAAVLGLFHGGISPRRWQDRSGRAHALSRPSCLVPTALLPSQGVRWDAGLWHGQPRAAREQRQDMVMLPWEGCWSAYDSRNGLVAPLRGEAAWLGPEGRRAYFTGVAVGFITHGLRH